MAGWPMSGRWSLTSGPSAYVVFIKILRKVSVYLSIVAFILLSSIRGFFLDRLGDVYYGCLVAFSSSSFFHLHGKVGHTMQECCCFAVFRVSSR